MTLATIAVLTSVAGAAAAAEVEVKMLNKGPEAMMVFEPALVKIEPGDTVKFVAADNGVKCTPHYGIGMVALIVVETPGNLAEVKTIPQTGKARQVFAALFEKLPTYAAAAK